MKYDARRKAWVLAKDRRADPDDEDVRIRVLDDGYVWIGIVESTVGLSRDNVRELLPLLQHFAETGTLPEPKP